MVVIKVSRCCVILAGNIFTNLFALHAPKHFSQLNNSIEIQKRTNRHTAYDIAIYLMFEVESYFVNHWLKIINQLFFWMESDLRFWLS